MAATCAKCVIIIVNIVFTLLGLGFVIGGIFIKVGEKYYKQHLDKFQDEIPDIAGGIGLSVDDNDKDKDAQLDIGSILQSLWIVLLVFGLFMTITGILGMCGACCQKKFMLVLYIIIVGVIFLAQLAVLIILVTKTFEDRIKQEAKDIIEKKFGGIDDFSVESLSMNYIMLDYKCCGVDGYKDFEDAKKWKNNRILDVGEVEANYIMVTPAACCKTKGKIPKLEIKSENCTIEPTDEISNWKTGCWDAISDDIEDRKIIFLGVFAGILAFELLCIVLAICIMCKEKDDD